jgi:hypothetical protein
MNHTKDGAQSSVVQSSEIDLRMCHLQPIASMDCFSQCSIDKQNRWMVWFRGGLAICLVMGFLFAAAWMMVGQPALQAGYSIEVKTYYGPVDRTEYIEPYEYSLLKLVVVSS